MKFLDFLLVQNVTVLPFLKMQIMLFCTFEIALFSNFRAMCALKIQDLFRVKSVYWIEYYPRLIIIVHFSSSNVKQENGLRFRTPNEPDEILSDDPLERLVTNRAEQLRISNITSVSQNFQKKCYFWKPHCLPQRQKSMFIIYQDFFRSFLGVFLGHFESQLRNPPAPP